MADAPSKGGSKAVAARRSPSSLSVSDVDSRMSRGTGGVTVVLESAVVEDLAAVVADDDEDGSSDEQFGAGVRGVERMML